MTDPIEMAMAKKLVDLRAQRAALTTQIAALEAYSPRIRDLATSITLTGAPMVLDLDPAPAKIKSERPRSSKGKNSTPIAAGRDVTTYRGQIAREAAKALLTAAKPLNMHRLVALMDDSVLGDEQFSHEERLSRISPALSQCQDFKTENRLWDLTDAGRDYWAHRLTQKEA